MFKKTKQRVTKSEVFWSPQVRSDVEKWKVADFLGRKGEAKIEQQMEPSAGSKRCLFILYQRLYTFNRKKIAGHTGHWRNLTPFIQSLNGSSRVNT